MSDIPREEVARLIRESGMSFHLGMPHESVIEQLTRFSSMLRDEILEAAEHAIQCAMEFEREECAGICDRFGDREMNPHECAAAIRAREKINV
jgi:hypothetical protein